MGGKVAGRKRKLDGPHKMQLVEFSYVNVEGAEVRMLSEGGGRGEPSVRFR